MSSLSGHVRTAKGAPVPDLSVRLEVPDGSCGSYRVSTKTGPDGAWSIAVPASSVPCGVHVIQGPIPVGRYAAPGSVDVDFVLRENTTGALRVHVVDSATGEPVPNPSFVWRRTGDESNHSLHQWNYGTASAPKLERSEVHPRVSDRLDRPLRPGQRRSRVRASA
jgi:5-hydroxyisourate hydrolase-like protein (transthyretin family)